MADKTKADLEKEVELLTIKVEMLEFIMKHVHKKCRIDARMGEVLFQPLKQWKLYQRGKYE